MTMKISDILPDFLTMKEIEEGRSSNTTKAYRHDISLFTRVVGDIDISQFKTFHVRKFLRLLHEREYSMRGLARKIATLRAFCHFLRDNELLSDDPMKTVKSPKINPLSHLPKFLTLEETGRVFDRLAAHGGFPHKKRARLEVITRLLYATMIRVSELVTLKLGDIDFHKGIIRVLGKGNKERLVPVDEGTLTLICEYLILDRDIDPRDSIAYDEFLLASPGGGHLSARTVQRQIHKLREAVEGLEGKKVTPHVFRHTGATHLRRNGMDLSELQDLLGHSNPNTTRIYARNDITVLKRSYIDKHPLVTNNEK